MACEGCKKNKLVFQRRGFLAGMAFFASRAPLFRAQQTRAATVNEAMKLTRLLNTVHKWRSEDGEGYVDYMPLLHSPQLQQALDTPIAAKLGITAEWVNGLNLNSDEILPGWAIKHALTPGGYTINLTSADASTPNLKTDQEGVIDIMRPAMLGWTDKLHASLFRCVGPIGLPGCCCDLSCCDQCHCCGGSSRCFNCGCPCCKWCETLCT